MKVSIVTPSYNLGKYIKHCIDSVRTQTHRPIEHILVDNCSTDETKEILEDYQRNPNGVEVKIIIEPDKGQSEAINKGFFKSSGDIIAWLNADECYLPDAIYKVVNFFAKHPEVDLVFGDCIFVYENKNKLKHKREFGFDPMMLLYYGCYIPSCATFFKRNIIDEGLLLNTEFRNCMDLEYYIRLSNKGKKFKHLPEKIAYFRWHQNNTSLVHSARRRKEKLRIQIEYGVKIGDEKMRRIIFDILKWFYIAKRNWMRLKWKIKF